MEKEKRYLLYTGLVFLGVAIGVILTGNLEMTSVGQAGKRTSLLDANFSLPGGSNPPAGVSTPNGEFTGAFIEINKRVTPAVVSISTSRKISLNEAKKYHDEDSKLWDLLPDRLNPFRSQPELRQGGSGSGIIVHGDGYILTNTHVVEKATQLEVTLVDNRSFPGEIVGIDPLTEVAVIKISADDIPVAALGNSDDLEVGQWVMAIGNPLELRFTVTAGIVSAIGRQMSIIRDVWGIENFIQTDAVINPGNSGGALVNLNGEVIGVNTAIATRSGFYEGYGFAIPINLARSVMEDLITKGRVIRPYLGIQMQQMDHKKAKAFGMDRPEGVFIDAILNDSPAQKAGLQAEDILLEVDGIPIERSNQVQSLIAQKKPDDIVDILIFRKGKRKNIKVVLAERPNEEQVSYEPPAEEEQDSQALGLEVQTLGPSKARELRLDRIKGVLVTDVQMYSFAMDAGLQINDVITEINSGEVSNENEFWSTIQSLESGDVAMLNVYRGNGSTHLFLQVP